MNLRLISLLWLTSLLTSVGSPQALAAPSSAYEPADPVASQKTDRRADVKAAFENFLPIIYFLSGSSGFLSQLNEVQRDQFQRLGEYLIKNQVLISSSPQPVKGETSAHIDFGLKFSDQAKDFLINPGEGERTAKVDDDVWFNLRIINAENSTFTLLDALQILVHEFGHKLEKAENIAAMNFVAAKMREYLTPYYREHSVSVGFVARTLVLPVIYTEENFPVDFQPEPVLILEFDRQATQWQVDLNQMRYPGTSYASHGAGAQAFSRVELVPTLRLGSESLVIEWSIQSQEFLFHSHPNYLQLFSDLPSLRKEFAVNPMAHGAQAAHVVPWAELAQGFRNFGQSLKSQHLQLTNYSASPYVPADQASFNKELRIVRQSAAEIELEGTVQSDVPIREVSVEVQTPQNEMDFPGEVTSLGDGEWLLRFKIPRKTADARPFRIQTVRLNSEQSLNLAERIDISGQPLPPGRPQPRLVQTEVWQNEAWVRVDQVSTQSVESDGIRFRFSFAGAAAPLTHIEFDWLAQDQILEKSVLRGYRFRRHREIVPASRLRQVQTGTNLVVEVTASKAQEFLKTEVSQSGFEIKDAGFRSLERTSFVSQDLAVVSVGAVLTKGPWRSTFALRSRPAGDRCESLFNLSNLQTQ